MHRIGSRRPHRRTYNTPGHAHELTFSCYHGYQFLSAERACQWLARAIDAARIAHDFDLWAYVFMPEHVHLVVHPRQRLYEMADIRQAIKEPTARNAIDYLREHAPHWLPKIAVKKQDRIRHLFWQRGGGYDRNIEEPATLQRMIDYIHLNPVRRGLVERAGDWKWSNAAWYVRGEGPIKLDPIPPEWLHVINGEAGNV
jgi:putative transposase